MKNEFVPYQQSLELKELGFDEECFGRYLTEEAWKLDLTPKSFKIRECQNSKCSEFDLSAPTYSQAFRWFRDKHELDSEIYMNHEYGVKIYTYLVLKLEKTIISHKSGYAVKQNTYEEAELECLKKLIEIVKDGK